MCKSITSVETNCTYYLKGDVRKSAMTAPLGIGFKS